MSTEAQVLAAIRAQLVAGLVDEEVVDKSHIVAALSRVDRVGGISGGGGGSGTATTPADIAQGIDASTRIDAVRLLLADIKAELTNTQAIADIFIQDSSTTPRYFIRQDRIDQTTGTITVSILNLDGTAPSTVPVLPLLPVKAGSTNLINEDLYVAQIAGTGYATGDSIANVRLLNGETATILASSWYNITTRSAIATPPAVADLKGYEDKLEELLSAIAADIIRARANSLAQTTLTIAAGATASYLIPANCRNLIICINSGMLVHFTEDGSTPTANNCWFAGGSKEIWEANIPAGSTLKLLAISAATVSFQPRV